MPARREHTGNRNTVEFLGIWEQIHNPDFNYGDFAIIKSQTGIRNPPTAIEQVTHIPYTFYFAHPQSLN